MREKRERKERKRLMRQEAYRENGHHQSDK